MRFPLSESSPLPDPVYEPVSEFDELELGLSKEDLEFLFPSPDPEYSLFYAIILLMGSIYRI